MTNKTEQIKNSIAKTLKKAIETNDGYAIFANAVCGFYVRHFNEVCTDADVAEKLAVKIVSATVDAKQEFVDMMEQIDPDAYDEMGVRVCSTCGKLMNEGYYLGGDYACSEDCAVKNYMNGTDGNPVSEDVARQRFESDLAYDEETCAGEVYWTEW